MKTNNSFKINKLQRANEQQSIGPQYDFRLFLQSELLRRCEVNQGYSLRSFAKGLRINPATLSSILSKKRKITEKTVRQLAPRLELSPEQLHKFLGHIKPGLLVKAESQNEYKEITHDIFVSIAEWYYDAILEMTNLKSFKLDSKWISRVLSIPLIEASAALDRLQRLGLLKKNSKGKWKTTVEFNSNILDPDFSSVAMRKYQKRLLEKSIEALENLTRSQRDHTSMMVVASSKDVSEIKELAKKFRREVAERLKSRGTNAEEVYQLTVSFFPISKIKNSQKGSSNE